MNEMPPVGPPMSQNTNPVQTYSYPPQQSGVARIASRAWGNVHIWRVLTLVLVLSVGLQILYVQPLKNFYALTDPDTNGYVEPRDLGAIIGALSESVVTVNCDNGPKQEWIGTGWAFEYQGITSSNKSALMTNHHVIESCIDSGEITIEDLNGKIYSAKLERYDSYNDLAVLTTNHVFPVLKLADYPPANGYWVMAYGSADGYSGSVATGNIINIDEYGDLLITANLSGGNSGGPLIDNEGNVFGVNTWSYNSEEANTQYNIAVSLDSFCDVVFECDGETYWDWDY
jgi:S1-C subfamily serine protease